MITFGGINASNFDSDYEQALIKVMEETLNENSGGGASVTLMNVTDLDRRRLVVGMDSGPVRTIVSYSIRVLLEMFNENADSIFNAVDSVLSAALQSSSLENNMNSEIEAIKGLPMPVITIGSIQNDESGLVIFRSKTMTPTAVPTEDSRDKSDFTLLLIIAAGIILLCLVCACGVCYLCCSRSNESSSVKPDQGMDQKRNNARNGVPPLVLSDNQQVLL